MGGGVEGRLAILPAGDILYCSDQRPDRRYLL